MAHSFFHPQDPTKLPGGTPGVAGPPIGGSTGTLVPTQIQGPGIDGTLTGVSNPTPGLGAPFGAGGSVVDEEGIARLLGRGFDDKRALIDSALATLTGAGGRTAGFFDNLIGQTEANLPVDPFSDALRQLLGIRGNELITGQSQELARKQSTALAGRGLSSGGSTGRAGGADLFGQEVGARNSLNTQVQQQQLAFNEAANRARQTLLGQLTSAKSSSLNQLDSLGAQIEAGSFDDPEAFARLAESSLVRRLDDIQFDELFALAEEQGGLDKIADIIRGVTGGFAASVGGPGFQAATSGFTEAGLGFFDIT